ncbi:hypothetical protein DdX_02037 [Ditylenchus destructor]|uniref:Uncharacterized protein n=1 Tax=Ditylenchus destructor TaxID=166010 RepID=A0AAD4NGK8_9BILA|nr:hypothetical protein DdX_02037 [Ditylenchus destructor]
MYRSSSVDLSSVSRERYLSRWSRENTPVDNGDRYQRHIRRSFTPIRDISAFEVVRNEQRSRSVDSYRTPIGLVNKPYHTNVSYYSENQPVRKYDVFQVRTWAYPIHKYIYGRDHHYTRPYSFTRQYATKSLYTPSLMTPEATNLTARRSYSGYSYVAGEHSFNVSAKPWSLSNYRHLRAPHISSHSTMPWYWYGRSNLRHYNSYRPPAFTTRLSSYWQPYY